MLKLDGGQEKFITNLFRGHCPFCLSKNPCWRGKNKVFSKRFIFQCSNCGAEISFDKLDIDAQNYKNPTVIIENAQEDEQYRRLQWQKISFNEFYNKCILSQNHRAVKHIEGTGFPDSCRLCDYGKNLEDDVTRCTKFGMKCSSNSICDSYTDEEWKQTTDMYFASVYKRK